MIVDPSAIIAILKREAEAAVFSAALNDSAKSRMSAANFFESAMVVDRWKNPTLSARLDELLEQFDILIEPVTAEQARIARQAYRDYGRGSGHPANLNFGDCFSYALARDKREPILFKGEDFIHTDLRSAIKPDRS
jgi:ribonuclease VapC